MLRHFFVHLSALSLLVSACASVPEARFELEEPRPMITSGAEASLRQVTPEGPRELRRAELDTVLLAGPGTFLGRISVTPALLHGRFMGFRLTRCPDLTRWNHAGADLHLGDVIQRINGISVERPEGVMAIFAALRGARELRVDVLRDGRPVVIAQPIVDPRPLPLLQRPQ